MYSRGRRLLVDFGFANGSKSWHTTIPAANPAAALENRVGSSNFIRMVPFFPNVERQERTCWPQIINRATALLFARIDRQF